MPALERTHVREITSNHEFNLSEHYSINRQLRRCSAGPSDYRICLANDGDCSICHKVINGNESQRLQRFQAGRTDAAPVSFYERD